MTAPPLPALTGASPEAELFWSASSPWPSPERVRAALGRADLAVVADAAEAHRVGPLVLAALDASGATLDEAVLGRLRAEAGLRFSQERLLLPHALQLALGPLVAAGMRPTIIKGPTLVGRYPGPGLRPMDDLDVLLPVGDHPRAIQLLVAAGWRHAAHGGPTADVPFVHPDVPGLPLELHHEFETWANRTTRIRLDELVAGAHRAEVLGVEAFVLEPELELVVLAAHAAKPWHVYNRLIWAADLAVVSRSEDLDWALVLRHAEQLRCRTAVGVGGVLASRLGGAFPPGVTALRSRAARAGFFAPLTDPEMPVTPIPSNRRDLLGVALADGVVGRGRVIVGLVAEGRGAYLGRALRLAQGGVRWGWRLATGRGGDGGRS